MIGVMLSTGEGRESTCLTPDSVALKEGFERACVCVSVLHLNVVMCIMQVVHRLCWAWARLGHAVVEHRCSAGRHRPTDPDGLYTGTTSRTSGSVREFLSKIRHKPLGTAGSVCGVRARRRRQMQLAVRLTEKTCDRGCAAPPSSTMSHELRDLPMYCSACDGTSFGPTPQSKSTPMGGRASG